MALNIIPDLSLLSNADLAQSADPHWNTLFAYWLARQALTKANEQFGPHGQAHLESDAKIYDLELSFGKGWRANSDAMALYNPKYEKVREQEEAIAREFYDPQTDAAIALGIHPAPTLAAALFKIELFEREQLYNFIPVPFDPWQIVADDFARLSA